MAVNVSQTNPRVYHKCAVGKKFQAAKGTAVTPTIFLKEADWSPNPQIIEFDPQGTHGSRFMLKQGHRKAYTEPACTLSYWASRSTLGILLENFTGSKQLASGSDVNASNASGLGDLIFTGIRLPDHVNNMSACEITSVVTEDGNGGSAVIQFYSASAASAGVLIASAALVESKATFSAIAKNNSGLSITGTLDDAGTLEAQIIVLQTQMQWADEPHSGAWFTMEIDTGHENYEFSDCWTKRFVIRSEGRTGVRIEEDIVALTLTPTSTSLTASITDNEFLAVQDITATYDSANSNISLPADGAFQVEGTWDIAAGPDNASSPEFFRRENPNMLVTVDTVPSDETDVILTNARAMTYKTLGADFSYGDYGATLDFGDVVPDPNVLVNGSGKAIDTESIIYRCRADGDDTTPSVATIKIQYHA